MPKTDQITFQVVYITNVFYDSALLSQQASIMASATPSGDALTHISSAKKVPDESQRLTSYLKDTWDDSCVIFPSHRMRDAELDFIHFERAGNPDETSPLDLVT